MPLRDRRPRCLGAADGLFRAIVVVVSKRTNLRLEFNSGQQPAIRHNQQIPLFLRAIPAGKFDVFLAVNVRLW